MRSLVDPIPLKLHLAQEIDMAPSAMKPSLLQFLFLLLLAITPFSSVMSSEAPLIKDIGSEMEVFDGEWEQASPPPAQHSDWVPINGNVFTSQPKGNIWIRGSIDTTNIMDSQWLVMSPLANSARVFLDGVPTSENLQSHLESPSQEEIPFHHFIFQLPSSESTTEISVNLQSEVPISTFFKLTNIEGLIGYITKNLFISVFFVAAISVLFIYNLLFYFTVKDTVYLWYSALGLSALAYTLSLTNLVAYFNISENNFNNLTKFALILMNIFSVGVFVRIIKVRELSIGLFRFYTSAIYFYSGVLTLSPILAPSLISLIVSSVSVFVYLSFIPVAAFRALQGYKPAVYFLIGWIPVIAAYATTAMEALGVFEGSQWIIYYAPAAFSWEMLLFSIALAARIKLLRDERDSLLDQKIEVSENARKALERSNRIKDDFLNAVSHELRTPLHTIQGQLDLLREAPLNNEQNQAFRHIEHANLRMTRQVGGILDFVDAQDDKLLSSPQVFELQSLFNLLAYELREAVAAKPLSLTFSIDDDLPSKLYMDGLMLEKVLYQLVDNAVKFTQPEGRVMVEASPLESRAMLVIRVSDNGPGIPEEHRNKVFKAFEQGDSGLARKYGGVGLGLPLANSLVNALGGSMSVVVSSNEGTVIEVKVPFGAVHLPQENRLDPANADAATSPPRVLVVEDDAGNRMIMRKQLEKMGVITEGVQNGLEAVESAHKEQWDMIIMDCQMPVMDGIEATKEIRHHAVNNLSTPIVAVTANACESFRQQCLEAGMDEYCTKPLRMAKLRKLVKKYAEQHQSERAKELIGSKSTETH